MSRGNRNGQSVVETVLLLPIFLFLAFGVLQLGQLGLALVMSNYAASSVARKAAAEDRVGGAAQANLQQYSPKANSLMVAGMTLMEVTGCVNATPPTASLTVEVRSKVMAFPMFGVLVNGALGNRYSDDSPGSCPDLANTSGFGPFNFSGSAPYYFYVRGRAKVRMNYRP